MHRDDEVKDNNGKALPRTVRVEVFPDPKERDGVGFRMFDSAAANPGEALDELTFSKAGNYKNDFHKITFVLENTQGLTLKFAKRKEDALWVVEGDRTNRPNCPRANPGKASGKTLRAIRAHDLELVAHNNNNEECKFSFALGVVAPGSDKIIPLDPGGSNQNGGEDPLVESGGINANVVIGAVAGVALLALAFVVLR